MDVSSLQVIATWILIAEGRRDMFLKCRDILNQDEDVKQAYVENMQMLEWARLVIRPETHELLNELDELLIILQRRPLP